MYYRNMNTIGAEPRFVGALLPFLAGVAVTTPFVFFAKNQNQQPVYYQPYPQPYPPPYYPMPYPPRPYPYM